MNLTYLLFDTLGIIAFIYFSWKVGKLVYYSLSRKPGTKHPRLEQIAVGAVILVLVALILTVLSGR
jgi:hypothetical protein